MKVGNATSLNSATSGEAILYLPIDELHLFVEVCARYFDASLDCVDNGPKATRTLRRFVVGNAKASVDNLPPPGGEFAFG